MGPSMFTLWLVIKSLGALGELVGSYCCSTYGVVYPFSLLGLPPLWTQCSVQWLAESIPLCICQELAGPFWKQLYQAPVSKHLLPSTIASGFSDCKWNGSPGGVGYGWPFPQSLLHTLSLYFLPWLFCIPSKKDQSIHTSVFLLHVVCGFYLGL